MHLLRLPYLRFQRAWKQWESKVEARRPRLKAMAEGGSEA